jgi:hypothetical protein
MSTHQLKHLQTQRNAMEALVVSARAKMVESQRQMEAHLKELKRIDAEIGKLQRKVIVSEHAIVRYFERVLGYDIEDIKTQILPPDVKQLVNGTFQVGIHKVKVKDNTIVTVLTNSDET